jgi:putative membrane protein
MYLYIKALHVLAVVTLIAGMLALALALRITIAAPDEMSFRRIGQSVLRWDALVTTPALAIVWVAGFTMAFGAGWGGSQWLLLKMVPAIFLSVLHSVEGLALKRLLQQGRPVHRLLMSAPFAIFFAFAIIAWLAVVKPF